MERERKFGIGTIFAALALLFCLTLVAPVKAEAADWQKLTFTQKKDYTYKNTTIGNYTFKYSSGTISVKKGSGSFQSTPLVNGTTWVKGSTAYFTDYSTKKLYKYDLSTGKTTSLKKITSKSNYSGSLSYVYSKYIYYTTYLEDRGPYKTYAYNTKTGKVKLVLKGGTISAASGAYCACTMEYRTDTSPAKVNLYKINSSGALKKVKTLSSRCFGLYQIDGKFYYTKYTKNEKQFTLYRCNLNGKKEKKLLTVKSNYTYGYPIVTEVTSKYCRYTTFKKNGQAVSKKYTYK